MFNIFEKKRAAQKKLKPSKKAKVLDTEREGMILQVKTVLSKADQSLILMARD